MSLLRVSPHLLILWTNVPICSFIGLYFICQRIYSCFEHVFNAWYLCVKCTNLWMNELRAIFIINLSPIKFAMCCCTLLVVVCCMLQFVACYYSLLTTVTHHLLLLIATCHILLFIVHYHHLLAPCVVSSPPSSHITPTHSLCCCYLSLTFATCDSSFILVLEL
jgi:hypothetical protein